MLKWLKRILLFLVVLAFLVVLIIFAHFKMDTFIPYDKPEKPLVSIPTFTEQEIDFVHSYDREKYLPIMGAGIIDVNGDDVPEIWAGGGLGQKDALFEYKEGRFKNIAEDLGLADKAEADQSYAPAVIDIDSDGDLDLLVGREGGIYLYLNENGRFTSRLLDLDFGEKSVPVGITVGDINQDGLLDIFASCYLHAEQMEGITIFNDPNYGAESRLFANRGDLKFEDITEKAGLAYVHNTFLAVLIDVDEDRLIDLVVAHDTGEPRTYKNLGGEQFKMMQNPMTGRYGYPMGIGVGDYNNDGKVDFFFSNVGLTMPRLLTKGDLTSDQDFNTDWMLFENQGGFQFKDVAKESQVAAYEFSWGGLFHDFNLDGKQDLAVAENYIDLPNSSFLPLPGRFLLNNPSGQFMAYEEEAGVVNKHFGISPISADFNQDGYPDLVYSNLKGPLRVWLNTGGSQNYLKVQLDESPASYGAKVQLTLDNGEQLSDWKVVGEGLGSDQSHVLTFGYDKERRASSLEVFYTDGSRQSLDSLGNNVLFKVIRHKEEQEVE